MLMIQFRILENFQKKKRKKITSRKIVLELPNLEFLQDLIH